MNRQNRQFLNNASYKRGDAVYVPVGSKFPDDDVDNCGKQMIEQVGKLFGEKKFSDVKITCGKEVFPCHRSILSVRSPVFAAMFQSDMKENSSRIVDIKDTKPEVVKEMLQFIYHGTTSTKNVLVAADQYQLNLLKNKCEEKMCSTLDVNNSVEMLVLADLHRTFKLRKMSLMLVADNMKTIVNTDVYKDFNARHPDLALEITKALVQKFCGVNFEDKQLWEGGEGEMAGIRVRGGRGRLDVDDVSVIDFMPFK